MYMLNYGIINNKTSLYCNSVEVLIDFVDSVISIHIFSKQFHFLLQPRVTYNRMNFHHETCLVGDHSFHFKRLVA